MVKETFKAMVVRESPEGVFSRQIEDRPLAALPPGEVLVRVRYSSLNYKDVLSATGNKGVTKTYPHTPGIDAAGVVVESASPACRPGEEVIVTSYDLGMNTPGGFGQFIRVPGAWVVKLPENLSLRESMIYGTAGFTGALSVYRLTLHGVTPEKGEVLVSGATGGVGGIALSILAQTGYHVVAVNGLTDRRDYLLDLGAKEVISVAEATDTSGKPLLKSRWAGAIDTLGGPILATTIRSTQYGAVVTCCGNVASPDLPLNVYPFIIRGVTLVGIDSQNCPMETRVKVWQKIAGEWKLANLDKLTSEVDLDGLSQRIDLVLSHQHRGRTLVRLPE
ncbi:MAG: YhdH/YhfP family quinone oxidoreductase [Thermodesulfobacteriota bacterium]